MVLLTLLLEGWPCSHQRPAWLLLVFYSCPYLLSGSLTCVPVILSQPAPAVCPSEERAVTQSLRAPPTSCQLPLWPVPMAPQTVPLPFSGVFCCVAASHTTCHNDDCALGLFCVSVASFQCPPLSCLGDFVSSFRPQPFQALPCHFPVLAVSLHVSEIWPLLPSTSFSL